MSQPIPRFVIVRLSAGIIAMALAAAGVFFGIRYFQRQTEALDKLEAAREEIAETARKDVADGRGVETGAKRGKASIAALNDAASKLHGDDRKAIAASARVLEDFKQISEEYAKAYAAFKDAGMVRSSSLPSQEAIHEREELLQRFEEVNATFEESLKNVEKTARAEFQKQGLSEKRSEKWAASFAQGAHLDILLSLRAGDRELGVQFAKILELLDQRWGAWKPADNERVIFDKPADAKIYNALREQIVEIGERQRALQTEVMERNRATASAIPRRPAFYSSEFIGPVP